MHETNFASLGFSSQQLIDCLSSLRPTEFQLISLPSILANQHYDLVLRAPACSGKSIAVLLAMLDKCIQSRTKKPRNPKQVFAIIVAPSSESVIYLVERVKMFAQDVSVGISFAVKRNDETIFKSSSSVCDILIGTIDVLREIVFEKKEVDISALSYFVVKDAHLLENSVTFEDFYDNLTQQIFGEFLAILTTTQMHNNFDDMGLNVPTFIDCSSNLSLEKIVHEFFDVAPTTDDETGKMQYLLIFLDQLAQQSDSTDRFSKIVIFINETQEAEDLRDCLKKKNYSSFLMSNECSKKEIDAAIKDFDSNKLDIIICNNFDKNTFKFKANFAFNFDLPESSKDFHQLIGRLQQIENLPDSYLTIFSFFDCSKNAKIAYQLEKFFVQHNFQVPEFIVKAYRSYTRHVIRTIIKMEDHLRSLRNTFCSF